MMIRKIKEDDAGMFLNMLKRLDNETKNMMFEPGERKTTVDEIKADIRNLYHSNSLILVAEENGEIVGFLSAERGFANRIKHSAYIVIGILNDYRGKGIGTKLFEELEKWANEKNITRLELTVMLHNERGIRLYEKMGFKIEGIKERSLIVDGEYIDEYYMAKLM
ncbi:GNAT family N-acetyltransferase [Crassaminicella thermophila]|uniref:GNAT family N-acetyltransferase n=2 Tax=Crassaminicella thermophila TaxID=2599308 RepID=A0A5C0SH97_CRATE|nr:GNAT family N-acetyltransferase [Crassaminicella thermophila]QEK13570.1 GNAT family N-acetyltransferase [Crassaminicella thermophila]